VCLFHGRSNNPQQSTYSVSAAARYVHHSDAQSFCLMVSMVLCLKAAADAPAAHAHQQQQNNAETHT
jgi:hypothetical protein